MADVSIDASVAALPSGRIHRPIVFATASIGYYFYFDADGTFGYSKTTDGGATWGAQVEINSGAPHVAACTWFDQWTPGDSGTLIHLWYFNTSTSDIFWRSLDTSSDTLGTERTAFNGTSATAVRNAFCSGTKTRSGYLYVAFDIDAGAEHGLVRSTDSGTNWSANLASTFVIDTGASQADQCICFPATGTGDNNDMWAVYQDSSADALTMKMWDSSAAAEVESSTIQTMVENLTDGNQMGFAASIRHSDGAIIIASFSEMDTVTADLQVYEVTAVNAGSLTGITTKTAITTNIDDNYYPSVFIEQTSGDIYVAYNGKRDGSETLGTTTKVYYTKSTDDGASWSAGDTAYMEGSAGVVVQVWTPIMGPRFYAAWRVSTTLLGNFVNSLTFAAGTAFTQSLSAALSFVGADAVRTGKGMAAALAFIGADTFRTSKGMAAALSFAGASAKRTVRSLAGALSFAGALSATRLVIKALTGTLSFVGAQSKSGRKALSGALTLAGASAKRSVRGLAGSLSFVGSARKTSAKAFAGALSFVGTIRRSVAHKMTAALTWGGNFATQLVGGPVQFTKSLVASLSFSTAQAKFTRKGMAGALSFVGTAAKRLPRAFSGALAFAGNLAAKNVFTRAFTATLSFIGEQSKRIPMRLESALSFIGNVVGGIIALGGIFRNRRGSRGVNV